MHADTHAEHVRLPGGRFAMVLEKLLERQREQFLRSLGLRRVEPGALIQHRDVGEPDAGVPRRLRQ